MSRDRLARVKRRPRPEQWLDDEPITLAEAVALFFPEGPLTINSFRKAAKRGDLAVRRLLGKDFTTPRAVREMTKPCQVESQSRPASSSESVMAAAPSGSSSTAAGRSARDAAKKTFAELKAASENILRGSTSRQSAPVISLNSRSPMS